jgi:hypothetical protein
MAWTRDWRIYYLAATIFVAAGTIALLTDGFGLRPIFGFAMAAGMVLIGYKAKREAGTPPPA